jgi:hypothetical protein
VRSVLLPVKPVSEGIQTTGCSHRNTQLADAL